MSDLVGNPEDRISHKAHYSGFSTIICDVGTHNSLIKELLIEPRCEISYLESRGIVLSM